MKKSSAILLMFLALTSLCSCKNEQTEDNIKDANLLILESNISSAEPDSSAVFGEELYADPDGDGENELLAVYGDSDNHGSLWYSDNDTAVKLYGSLDWGSLRTAETDSDTLIIAERVISDTNSMSYCYRIDNGEPVLLETYGIGKLTQTDGNNFVGTVTSSVDGCTDGTGETSKPYWFYYEDGIFNEYLGSKHTYDENEPLADNDYLAPYFAEITAEGGEVQSYIIRSNGIININYTVKAEGYEFLAYRYFRTLYKDGENITDMTPEVHSGQYTASATGDLTDMIIY